MDTQTTAPSKKVTHSLTHSHTDTNTHSFLSWLLCDTVLWLQTVSRISQSKSVFSQSGNSRDVLPLPFNQSQSSAPHSRSVPTALVSAVTRSVTQFCVSSSGSPQVLSPSMTGPPNVQPRRSSRLFTSASSTAKVALALILRPDSKVHTDKMELVCSSRSPN